MSEDTKAMLGTSIRILARDLCAESVGGCPYPDGGHDGCERHWREHIAALTHARAQDSSSLNTESEGGKDED